MYSFVLKWGEASREGSLLLERVNVRQQKVSPLHWTYPVGQGAVHWGLLEESRLQFEFVAGGEGRCLR